jgi:cytochrome bd-type quinol oxidase subunit 1
MIKMQPMEMAAAEALWEGADPAPMSLVRSVAAYG